GGAVRGRPSGEAGTGRLLAVPDVPGDAVHQVRVWGLGSGDWGLVYCGIGITSSQMSCVSSDATGSSRRCRKPDSSLPTPDSRLEKKSPPTGGLFLRRSLRSARRVPI